MRIKKQRKKERRTKYKLTRVKQQEKIQTNSSKQQENTCKIIHSIRNYCFSFERTFYLFV